MGRTFWRVRRPGATLAGLALTVVGLLPRGPLTSVVRELADRIAAERGRERGQALGMSGDAPPANVRFRSPSRQDEPELVRWRSDGGPERGTLTDVAGYYRSLERGQLVVLGEPGSGKTVPATQLVLDLIEALPDGELQPLEPDVICRHLTDRFPGRAPGRMAARWEPVQLALNAVTAPGPAVGSVLDVLSGPWRLFLPVMAYQDDDTDPSKLLRRSGDAATSEPLEQLIPAVTALTPAPGGGRPARVRACVSAGARVGDRAGWKGGKICLTRRNCTTA